MLFNKKQKKLIKNKSVIIQTKKPQDRLTIYSNLKTDPGTFRQMNMPYAFPIQVYGVDGKTYILDQFPDQDGVFRFHVLARNGPYAYQQVYKGDAFMFKTGQDQSVGDKSSFIVKHYLGNQNSTDIVSGSTSVSDSVKSKGLGINWGNLLKAAPTVVGHVVQIGTTIASVLTPQDGTDQTIANNTIKTSSVPFKSGYYQISTNEVGDDSIGLSIACYDSSQVQSQGQGLIPKYVIPFIKWAKKVI